MKKLAIGMSTFSEIIEEDYIYVDKTQYIHKMISTGKTHFLSRPRRFGKSLLISTLEDLFKGNKELFESLYIFDKWDWNEKYPVVKIDFGKGEYFTSEELKISLDEIIHRIAREFSVEIYSKTIAGKFIDLISEIYKKTGQKVVILIDEYDKAIVKNMSNPKVLKDNKKILQSFYGALKAIDEYIRFLFVTGVSKFTGTSLFSDFNSPDDISLDYNYSSICGYTQEELENSFKDHIKETSQVLGCSTQTLIKWIKEWYNGYSWNGKDKVYNPFSILNFFKKQRFGNYWYRTGTPSFLKDKILAKNNIKPLIENTGDVKFLALGGFLLLFCFNKT